MAKKEVGIWRVWGGAEPVRSLVRESDHSFSLATWYYAKKRGGIYIPSTRERRGYKTYAGWMRAVKKYFIIKNKTISW